MKMMMMSLLFCKFVQKFEMLFLNSSLIFLLILPLITSLYNPRSQVGVQLSLWGADDAKHYTLARGLLWKALSWGLLCSLGVESELLIKRHHPVISCAISRICDICTESGALSANSENRAHGRLHWVRCPNPDVIFLPLCPSCPVGVTPLIWTQLPRSQGFLVKATRINSHFSQATLQRIIHPFSATDLASEQVLLCTSWLYFLGCWRGLDDWDWNC